MKRLISATLALSLLGGTAAVAAPYDHGRAGYGNQTYNADYRGDAYRGRGDNSGAIVAGVGLLALAAIVASSQDNQPYQAYEPYPSYGPYYQSYQHSWHQGWYNGGHRHGYNDRGTRGHW